MKKSVLRLGLQPFWFWNGDMKEEEIVWQIQEMKGKGVPGFMIHPRQGMEIPYMSQEYFNRVRLAVQTARENNMEVWIYDEYPYPSGICGGEVLLGHPEYLCKQLKKTVCETGGGREVRLFAPWGRVILARAYRVKYGRIDLDDYIDVEKYVGTGYQQEVFQYSGLTQYNKKRYFTGDPGKLLCFTPPEGQWKIYLVTEAVFNHFKYFENFVDTLNPEAIQYFISLTHERYKEHVGDEFGKTIKGFFTDEVTAFPDREPWSPLLPGKVLEKHGINLIDHLPAIWEDLGEISSRVRYAYWDTATDCFIDAYDRQVYEWCDRNNLLYIGEKPILRSKELQYVHIPGIDSGHQKAGSRARLVTDRYRSNGKLISSAAHFYDKPAALCEVGHSIGWGMTIQDMKWMFDWLAVQGVDWYVIHGYFFTTDGLKKHDAPPSAFFQMPWWKDAGQLTAYAAKLGDFLQSIKRQVKILVMDPVTSTWTSSQQIQSQLRADFGCLQNRMLFEQLDYYIIDPQLFADGVVVKEQGGTVFRIHGESYGLLLLPPMRNLEAGACGKVLEFARMGGKICSFGSIPFEKIEESDLVKELAGLFGADGEDIWQAYVAQTPGKSHENGNLYYGANVDDVIAWFKKYAPSGWQIESPDPLGRDALPSICGTDETGRSHLFLANTSEHKRTLTIRSPKGSVEHMVLDPFESRFFAENEMAMETTAESQTGQPPVVIPLDGLMEMSLGGQNALRLSTWQLELPDGQTAAVEAEPLIDQLEAGNFLRPVRQKNYFGCPKELDFVGDQVRYHTTFECVGILENKENRFHLVVEPGTFLGEWKIEVNGNGLHKKDFVQKKFYLHTNLAADVTDLLKQGENRIDVTVQVDVSYGGMRNPIYLFGNFGVDYQESQWILSPLPAQGSMENWAESGLPFYHGEITFKRPLAQLPELIQCSRNMDTSKNGDADARIWVKLSAPWLTDAVRLKIGGYESQPCAWSPYLFELPASLLQGKDDGMELEIRILTTAIGLFEGQRFDPGKQTYVDPFR